MELVNPNAVYSGSQTIFVDFDGAEDVSYDNDALNIHLDNLGVASSGLSEEQQSRIIAGLNDTFADAGVTFTASPGQEYGGQAEYSTIYVGGTGSAFARYGNFSGLAETLDAGNQIKSDKAFVFSDKLNSTDAITGAVAHEAGHLLGFQHKTTIDGNQSISSYAFPDGEQNSLKIVNNFKNNTQYFSANYSDDEVWLYFFQTGGYVSYIDKTTMQTTTVTDCSAFQLSTVQNGTFSIANGPGGSKLFAGLGPTNPFSGNNGPGIFDINIPYCTLEWTVELYNNDNVDVSYEDTFAFPTTLRVNDSNGVQVGKETFRNNVTAENLIAALQSAMPDPKPVGPLDNYPVKGQAAGWGPLVPTVASDASAQRWIGSSKYWQSGQVEGQQEDIYLYVPSLNDYLGYLKTNEQVLFPDDPNKISGWYIDYSGNQGYSCYLSVTGSDGNYGLQIHDIRCNAGGSAPDWTADPAAGTALNGTITVAANNANVTTTVPHTSEQYNVQGNWTDLTIYSGASLLNSDFASGPIITGTGDFAAGGQRNTLNSTIMASVSASIATGLLGSQNYINQIQSAQPGATMYWFQTLPRDQYSTTLFSAAWPPGQQFYDPYWKTLADYTNMHGYLSPYNDRWSNFSPDISLNSGYSIQLELGTLPLDKMVPEDFNGDGRSDILFTDGTSLGYYADGQPSRWQTLGDYASGWQIAGSADFDGNGTDGVLFSNGSQIGYYSGGKQAGWKELGSYTAGWQIAGCGDFNGNGKDDILFTDGTSLGCYVDGQPSG